MNAVSTMFIISVSFAVSTVFTPFAAVTTVPAVPAVTAFAAFTASIVAWRVLAPRFAPGSTPSRATKDDATARVNEAGSTGEYGVRGGGGVPPRGV